MSDHQIHSIEQQARALRREAVRDLCNHAAEKGLRIVERSRRIALQVLGLQSAEAQRH